MAKTVTRKNLKQFGVNGNSNNFGQFGSVDAGSPLKTKAIETIQALSAWLTGWQDAVVSGNKAPFLEDMNGIMYVMFYQLFYMFQDGIPEWNADTTYFTGSYVRTPDHYFLFTSKTDDNLNNALPAAGASNTNWTPVLPMNFTDLLGSIALSQIPDSLITSPKIDTLDVAKLSGLILAAQIQSLDVSQLTGILSAAAGGTGTNHKIMSSQTYLGNGTNNHLVAHGLGVQPDLVVIMLQSALASQIVIWSPTLQAGYSRYASGGVSANDITDADATNVRLGTSGNVNTNGAPYTVFSFKGQ